MVRPSVQRAGELVGGVGHHFDSPLLRAAQYSTLDTLFTHRPNAAEFRAAPALRLRRERNLLQS